MKRANWKPTKYSVLYEKHFTLDDYAMPQTQSVKCAGQMKKYLKHDAVPSTFYFPKHLRQTQLRIENLQQREKPQVQKNF